MIQRKRGDSIETTAREAMCFRKRTPLRGWKGHTRMNELEKEIVKLEEELTQTESRLDVDGLDRIYADDIMVTAPIGICVDKPAVMSEIRMAAEKAIIGRYDKDDLKVRGYGDTAVSSYRMTAWATVEGTEIKRALCITNVWMKRTGNWEIVARHTASLPQDTPPAGETSP
jgi:ketosteroid isomerase-like protein